MKRVFFLLFLLVAGCAHDGRTKLLVYSPHGKEMLSDFEHQYEALHPDVDVQWLDMGSQEILDRVTTESRNTQADIWWGAPSTLFMRAEKLDLLQPYKPSWAAAVATAAKSKNDCWYGTYNTPQVIAFNEKLLRKEDAPQSWAALISPAWKGKIIIRSPLSSGTMRAIFAAMVATSVQQTGKENGGWEWLRRLDKNTFSYAADPAQLYAQLNTKDSAVTLWNMPDIILQKMKLHYPFGYIFPKEGTVVLTDGIAILKACKHPEAAKRFYEFVTSRQSILQQAKQYYRIPARTDIDKTQLPAWIAAASYQPLKLDWELMAAKESKWMKYWDANIKGD